MKSVRSAASTSQPLDRKLPCCCFTKLPFMLLLLTDFSSRPLEFNKHCSEQKISNHWRIKLSELPVVNMVWDETGMVCTHSLQYTSYSKHRDSNVHLGMHSHSQQGIDCYSDFIVQWLTVLKQDEVYNMWQTMIILQCSLSM